MKAEEYNPYKGDVWSNKTSTDDYEDKMKYLDRKMREGTLTLSEFAFLSFENDQRFKYYFYNKDGSPPKTKMEMEGPNYFDVIEHAKESKRRQDIFK
jgi:hypothetical protein